MFEHLQAYNIVILYGIHDIKTDVVTEVVRKFPGYNKIDRNLYSFPALIFQKIELGPLLEHITKNIVLELNKIYSNKAYKKDVREGKRDIYIHIQHSYQLEESLIVGLMKAAEKLETKGIAFP